MDGRDVQIRLRKQRGPGDRTATLLRRVTPDMFPPDWKAPARTIYPLAKKAQTVVHQGMKTECTLKGCTTVDDLVYGPVTIKSWTTPHCPWPEPTTETAPKLKRMLIQRHGTNAGPRRDPHTVIHVRKRTGFVDMWATCSVCGRDYFVNTLVSIIYILANYGICKECPR